MSDLLKMTATEARNSLLKKEISSVELLNAYQNAMEKTEALNNYVTPTLDVAKQMAVNADKAYAQGSAGPLAGLPIGVKDLFCTKDIETTACSAILKGFSPSYESTVTSNIWQSGGVMLGKLNCDEFAMGSSNETSIFGPAVNPWSKIDGIDLSSGVLLGFSFLCSSRFCLNELGHRYGRFYPSTRCILWCGWIKAYLWTLFQVGYRCVCVFSRPGGPIY